MAASAHCAATETRLPHWRTHAAWAAGQTAAWALDARARARRRVPPLLLPRGPSLRPAGTCDKVGERGVDHELRPCHRGRPWHTTSMRRASWTCTILHANIYSRQRDAASDARSSLRRCAMARSRLLEWSEFYRIVWRLLAHQLERDHLKLRLSPRTHAFKQPLMPPAWHLAHPNQC